jgi:hypothetical protein
MTQQSQPAVLPLDLVSIRTSAARARGVLNPARILLASVGMGSPNGALL